MFIIFWKLFWGMFSWVILLCCRGAGGRVDLEKHENIGRASTFSMCAFLRAVKKKTIHTSYEKTNRQKQQTTNKNTKTRKTSKPLINIEQIEKQIKQAINFLKGKTKTAPKWLTKENKNSFRLC